MAEAGWGGKVLKEVSVAWLVPVLLGDFYNFGVFFKNFFFFKFPNALKRRGVKNGPGAGGRHTSSAREGPTSKKRPAKWSLKTWAPPLLLLPPCPAAWFGAEATTPRPALPASLQACQRTEARPRQAPKPAMGRAAAVVNQLGQVAAGLREAGGSHEGPPVPPSAGKGLRPAAAP